MSLINTTVQPFKTSAFHNGKFIEVTEASLKGKWSVVVFMPAAFTFNCPTEVEDAADNYAEFQKAGAEVYIVTTDTHFSHKVWHETSPAVGKAKFPLVGDPTHALTRAFGVHIDEEGPGAARHLHHQSRRRDQDHGSPRQRDRPRHEGDAAQAEGRPVRRCPPGRGLPGQVEGRREDPRAVAGPGRQDLSCPSSHRRPWRRLQTGGATAGSPAKKGVTPCSTHPLDPAPGLPRAADAADRAGVVARRQRRLPRARRLAGRDRVTVGQDHAWCAATTTRASPPSRSSAWAPTSACASPASRSVTSSPRWCWRCCRSAAIRRRSSRS